MIKLVVCTLFLWFAACTGFCFNARYVRMKVGRIQSLTMEYIPDGISKAQWTEMKKKEAEKNMGKDLSKVGITKFQSRSFEAWQKSGQAHLYPVDPKTPVEKRPYMQRQGGSADGADLVKKGKIGEDQAKPACKTDVDLKYEKLNVDGKLKSSPFSVPWTADAAAKQFSGGKWDGKAEPKLSQQQKNSELVEKVERKKWFFGLF